MTYHLLTPNNARCITWASASNSRQSGRLGKQIMPPHRTQALQARRGSDTLTTDKALVVEAAPVFDAIRTRVSAVIVPNTEAFKVEVKGRLAELCGIEAFPQCSKVTRPLVAGEASYNH
jgi:hypothetical protein